MENVKAEESVTLLLDSGVEILPTVLMTKEQEAEIANHFFIENSRGKYKGVVDTKKGVALRKENKVAEQVELGGLRLEHGLYMLYQINSAAELGVLLRLLGLFGQIELVLGGDEPFAPSLRLKFGGKAIYY